MGYASIYENYLLIEIKNGIIGKKREYNAEEYIKFRDKQFEAFKKTDEYKQQLESLKKKSENKNNDWLEHFLKEYSIEYTSEFLVP